MTLTAVARPQLPARMREAATRETRLLITLAWAHQVIPSYLQVRNAGRSGTQASNTVALDPTSAMVSNALTAIYVFVVLIVLARSLHNHRTFRSTLALSALLSFWSAAFVVTSYLDGPQKLTALLFPLTALTLWLRPPCLRALSTLGVLTAISASLSLILAVLQPSVGLVGGNTKALYGSTPLVGTILGGPYSQGNVLGIVLALGFPFIALIEGKAARRSAFAVVLAALVWSASRTSLSAVAAVILMSFVILRRTHAGKPSSLVRTVAPLVTTAAVCAYLPFASSDPTRFTARGQIWAYSLDYWPGHALIGFGSHAYEKILGLSHGLGGQYTHGHNLLVNTLVTGGMLGVALLVGLLLVAASAARQHQDSGFSAPLLFLISMLTLGWFEASFASTELTDFAFWFPLTIILLGRSTPPNNMAAKNATVRPAAR